VTATATTGQPETRYQIRGAAGDLGTLIRSALETRGLGADGKPLRNGGVPKEIMLSGPASTGKSWSVASILLGLCTAHQGIRVLIVRKTRASLTESVCVTIEKILGSGSKIVGGVSREHRHDYKIGKSVIVLGSMENPDRLYSTEWDVVWIEEAREVAREGYLKFLRAIRNNAVSKLPFQLLLTTTNPDSPAHHLYQRALKGKIHHLVSDHKDNPAMWDEANQTWHPYGLEVLDSLDALDGNLYKRLRKGEWVAAEGAIYPDYDPALHTCTLARDAKGWVTAAALEKIGTRAFYAGIDFGYAHPGTIMLAAFTSKRELYVIEQVMMTGEQVSWFAEKLHELHLHYPLTLAFCDHARPDGIDLFNEVLGAQPEGSPGAIAVKANKEVFKGLQVMRARISREDPSMFFDTNSLKQEDKKLAGRSQPTRAEQEIGSYVFKSTGLMEEDGEVKDDPVKKWDDAMDGCRYLCLGVHHLEPPPRQKRFAVFPDGPDESTFTEEFISEGDEEWDRIQGEVTIFA
jgi:phage terminase large subunit